MAILLSHVPWYVEIFRIPDLLAEPIMLFGRQEIRIPPIVFKGYNELSWRERFSKARLNFVRRLSAIFGRSHPDLSSPSSMNFADLTQLLISYGYDQIDVLDLFDPQANLRHDMNRPVPQGLHGRYRLLIDIGCLEHVFDTWTCLSNCLRMISIGGHYCLQTPVNGYFAHGLHVFNPGGLLAALQLNGFRVIYKKYSNSAGAPISRPDSARDALLWLIARKETEPSTLAVPQQSYWSHYYLERDPAKRTQLQHRYWSEVG